MKPKMSEQKRREIEKEHWSWLKMIMLHSALGMGMCALIGYLIIHYDMRRIGTMIGKSEYWFGYTFLLMWGFASIFGMIAAGFAIWTRADREYEEFGSD